MITSGDKKRTCSTRRLSRLAQLLRRRRWRGWPLKGGGGAGRGGAGRSGHVCLPACLPAWLYHGMNLLVCAAHRPQVDLAVLVRSIYDSASAGPLVVQLLMYDGRATSLRRLHSRPPRQGTAGPFVSLRALVPSRLAFCIPADPLRSEQAAGWREPLLRSTRPRKKKRKGAAEKGLKLIGVLGGDDGPPGSELRGEAIRRRGVLPWIGGPNIGRVRTFSPSLSTYSRFNRFGLRKRQGRTRTEGERTALLEGHPRQQ